jgi:molybdenum cofactor cytidylyltransferase
MSPAGKIAAIVLAAGKSSRMGTNKPLLPLGSTTVIERVTGSVSRAGIDAIVVVTGHNPEALAPVLDRLAVRRAHNAGYESGMFSSVQTGVRALADDVEAFFVLPADYPLVRTEVLRRLIESFHDGESDVLHPSCCGLRGHPPLLSGRYRQALVEADDGDNLGSFFRRHADDQAEVDVEDLTILLDMDTTEDFQRVSRFAAILDQAPQSPIVSLSPHDALYLLSLLEVPDPVVRHCRTVAAIGTALAEALKPRVPDLDVDLVRTVCLLHDMAKGRRGHALAAQRILSNLGLPRLGEIAGAHMVMPAEKLDAPSVTEAQLVYLADKMVIKDQFIGVEGKAAHAFHKHGSNPEALEGARVRMRTALIIRDRVESLLGRPLEEVLPREIPPSI